MNMENKQQEKYCPNCHRFKEIKEFTRKYGWLRRDLSNQCKECESRLDF